MRERLEKVRQALAEYEHPLFEFSARGDDAAVVVEIRFKSTSVPVHTYEFTLRPCEIDHRSSSGASSGSSTTACTTTSSRCSPATRR